jgi:hypothetical protein
MRSSTISSRPKRDVAMVCQYYALYPHIVARRECGNHRDLLRATGPAERATMATLPSRRLT